MRSMARMTTQEVFDAGVRRFRKLAHLPRSNWSGRDVIYVCRCTNRVALDAGRDATSVENEMRACVPELGNCGVVA